MPEGGLPPPPAAVLTLPNAVTLARLCAVPVAVWLVIRREWSAAFALFVAAGLSDALDGWLARRRGSTALGAALDPVADKLLMVGMVVTLAGVGQLPAWIAILIVFRDLLIVGGVVLLWMLGHGVAIRPIGISKANTALQMAVIALVLGLNAAGLALPVLRWAATWLVAATTMASGVAYVARLGRWR